MLALVLICAPLTIGTIWAFPVWDDGWLWLLINEKGTGIIRASEADRPIMAALWSLLAPSEPALWRASFVAQALLWPTFGIMSALLWTYLLPSLRQYAMVVGCVTVAPIISKVQMVAVNIALGHLLCVTLGYGALLLLLRFVIADGRFGGAVLGLGLLLLGCGILLMEYALPIVIVMVIFFWSYAWRVPDAATRVRAWRAIIFSISIAAVAYGIYFIIADYSARPSGWRYKPSYIFTLGAGYIIYLPFKLAEGIWRSVAGGFLNSMGDITLSSKLGVMAAAYGALVAGLLFYGSRNAEHKAGSSSNNIPKHYIVAPAIALVAGFLPFVAMARIPWTPGDGMSSKFELSLLPVTVTVLTVTSLTLVRQRFWAVPILLFGFVAGNTTFMEVWTAIRERQQMSAIGAAILHHVAPEGYTVAAVVLPERSLGPRRDYELTARLSVTWPPEVRRRFWAYRFGGLPPIYRPDTEAEAIFGSRGDCKRPREFKRSIRHLTREGPLNQLLWIKPETDGSISVEPYCIQDGNEGRAVPRPGLATIELP
jgi:hypothetical protein